ncbi:FabD/lysophospholipase-like protein [Glarea lozoyensis ATCC 20868]|uniref:Lysophospholipase NTE1 n=1 Tax=Glarea lozoyensis (strain ATCC 20868 / MF5171) TaxID=1116229 RepID=S3CXD2_GLAL2|nr:FabD/lysophospholipase-like protein [Glarea lozoyensis ATCC 20868]EPE24486.1 FabD/lysophospholipase-like protein [Glarea lozoyensis ATCC 20868]
MSSVSTSPLASATATALEELSLQPSWLGGIGRMGLYLIGIVPGLLYWIITCISITMPTFLFTLFSTSLTVTMNATTLMLIMLAFMSTISWFVRYRFLNMYARLPPEPQRKEPQIDLYPDTQEEGSKSGFSNYLDEFLSAIKVFGYLERSVFHELTRSMQTRKLIAGETLNLEEEKGFCLVVDGLVEIFVKSSRESRGSDSETVTFDPKDSSDSGDDHNTGAGHQKYQLLTEVKNGAPMSSLFSILSLFTEDVKLRHTEDEEVESGTSTSGFRQQRFPSSAGFEFDQNQHDIPPSLPNSPIYGASVDGATSFRRKDRRSSTMASSSGGGALPIIPPLSLDGGVKPKPRPKPRRNQTYSAHPDIVARATVDTTIAIIPASAFRRLTRVYPKATAHIVQVILTRLQRVTLATGHSYLGLTSEVLRTEKHMNKYTTYELPNFLRGDALERLKEKFTRERERAGPEDSSKGIALHNAGVGRRRRSSNSLRKEATIHSLVSKGSPALTTDSFEPPGRDISTNPSPGDLLTNIHMSRSGGRRINSHTAQAHSVATVEAPEVWHHDSQSPLAQRTFNPFANTLSPRVSLHRQESIDEDGMFRGSVLECIFKAIGLTNTRNALRMSDSVEASPRLVSYDQRKQKAVFTNNAFGFMDPYEASADGDNESMTSGGISVGGYPSTQGLAHELKDEIEIVFFPQGSVLVEQGERNPGLYYVIDGFLDVSVPIDEKSESTVLGPSHRPPTSRLGDDGRPPLSRLGTGSARTSTAGMAHTTDKKRKAASRKSLALIKPGGIAGYIGTISSYRSFIDVVAKTDVYVGFLPRSSLERIVEKYPVVLLTMAKRLTSLLPKLILHIDFALEWVQVSAGQVIYHQGDDSDAIYIVLNGRLRLVLNNEEAEMKVVGEYGQGESVGELEVMTESTRPATLHAIRDTELAKFPRTLFNSLAQEHPGITIKISKIIASRMRSLIEDPVFDQGKEKVTAATSNKVSSTLNLRTVAILPVTAGVPVVEFASRLMNALTQIGATNGVTSLNQAAILNHLGRHAFSRMGKLKLSQYLADLEEKYGLVLYVADTNVNSPWTQTCISQADCILLVGLAEGSAAIGEYERFLLGMKTTARKELVLLHSDRFVPQGVTRAWLRNRVWINGGHHHVQMAFRTSSVPVHPQTRRFGSTLKQRVQVLQAEIQKYTSRRVRQTPLYSADTPFKGDFHRIARRLCGKSIGLVLGGGGARGIAQVGIIRALEEAGIPIDIIGGTSIGSFIGALYARDADVVPMYGRAKKFAGRMASMWRFALDLTYPSASYTTGHEFNRGIFKTFGNSQIEDFWLEFYCNTTNISKSRSEIHTSGYAWRYVRASMSLAGLLPPLCDEGSMLLDGGYVDNLTVTHMKSLGADVIFAIDVGSLDDDTPQTFGDSLSGFWAFANRWNPFSSYPNPPTLAEIQARLAYVSSVDALERAKNTPGCLYMRPPIDAYGTLDFGKFDEIYQVGYKFGQSYLSQMRDQGVLPLIDETEEKKALRRTMAPRRASI